MIEEIDTQQGIHRALDAILARRLALLCGAGLSMAPPSKLPSAADLAQMAKQKYDAQYGATRPPLAESIDEQAEFFLENGTLASVYLRTYIDDNAFASPPNEGHFAVADLLLAGGITTAVSTNVDRLIEFAGNDLFGEVGSAVDLQQIVSLPHTKSPLLKVHGCWSDRTGTIWARGQITIDPYSTRIRESSEWLRQKLLNCDLVIVGYCTDWDYLNEVLATSIAGITPRRVIVVDPCETTEFQDKAPSLFSLGSRADHEFWHVRNSGDVFLNQLRIEFSYSFVRQALHAGRHAYENHVGTAPNASWLEPARTDATTLWRIRRDIEGAAPNQPASFISPPDDPLVGMTVLQLQAAGAQPDGSYWNLRNQLVRVLRTPNRPLFEVQSDYRRETAPVVSANYIIAVGAEHIPLHDNIARSSGGGSIARGADQIWLSRGEAEEQLGL